MSTQVSAKPASGYSSDLGKKIEKLRELYADASQTSKTALENVIRAVQEGVPAEGPATQTESAGRIGRRQGTVSELTVIVPLKKGGANRLRGFWETLQGSTEGVELVGTVHDMRFVFLDNDTKLLFCTAYDGDWDAYIEDFATKIPDIMDIQFGDTEGWPGIHSPKVKDFIVSHQVSADYWYAANPNLSVVQTRRLQKIGKAVDEFLDKIDQ